MEKGAERFGRITLLILFRLLSLPYKLWLFSFWMMVCLGPSRGDSDFQLSASIPNESLGKSPSFKLVRKGNSLLELVKILCSIKGMDLKGWRCRHRPRNASIYQSNGCAVYHRKRFPRLGWFSLNSIKVGNDTPIYIEELEKKIYIYFQKSCACKSFSSECDFRGYR